MKIFQCTKELLILILSLALINSKEHVVFEKIGQMSGATSFIHVHVTLGIELMTQQVDLYRNLLWNNFNTTECIMDTFHKHSVGQKGIAMNRESFRSMAETWRTLAQQHRLDLLDIYMHLESLKNVLPDLPDTSIRTIQERHAKERYAKFDEEDLIRLAELEKEFGTKTSSDIVTHRFINHYVAEKPMPPVTPNPNHQEVFGTASPAKNITKVPYFIRRKGFGPKPDLKTSNIIDASALSPVHQRRRRMATYRSGRRRRLAGAIALPMAVAATAMGIYNTEQINFLKVELTKLQENQERLFDIVSRHSQILTDLSEGFELMLGQIRMQLLFNPALFDAKLTRLENQIRTRLRQVTHALQAGLVRKLAVDYLTPNEIRNLYVELVASSKRMRCDLLIDHHSDLFQLETSLLFDGDDAHLLIHVPMVPHEALLRLYKLHPIPLPLNSDYFLIPDVKNDVLALSTQDSRYAIQLSSTDLMGCFRSHQMFMCDRFGVLQRGYNETCLGALYNQQFEQAQHLCRFEVAPITERVYQLEKHHFLIYLPRSFTVPIICRNGSTTERHLSRGHQELHISPGCEVEFRNHKIMTDSSITFPADIVHYEWEWDQIAALNFMDPIQLPIELQNLVEKGISRPTLADLQFLAVTKGKIDSMVRPGENGLSLIHALGSTFLAIGVIAVAGFIAYKCYIRRKMANKKKQKNYVDSETSSSEHSPVVIRRKKSNKKKTKKNKKTDSPSTSSSPTVNIFTNPSAPSVVEEEEVHPLANDPKFRKHRKAPRPPSDHFADRPIRFNRDSDSVSFPYYVPQQAVVKESLFQQRTELGEALDQNTDRLAQHRSELVGELSEIDTYISNTLRKS